MVKEQAHYEYDLGNSLNLRAFSIDPRLSEDGLAQLLSSMSNRDVISLEVHAKDMHLVAKLDSLSELELKVLPERYRVPEQLFPYRQALDEKLLREGKKNNDVLIVKGDIKVPLHIIRGGYFDFMATKLSEVPSKLLPDLYPANKTIGELLQEYGLRSSDMARYLGFGFIVMPSNGEEISFVQRAKELGIVAGVMGFPGMTPHFHEDFLKENFNFQKYFEQEIARELQEEYRLLSNEFRTGRCYLIYNKGINHPFVAIEVTTPLSTKEIVRRTFGDKDAIKEHPILYSVDFPAISTLLRRFDLGGSAYVMNLVAKERGG